MTFSFEHDLVVIIMGTLEAESKEAWNWSKEMKAKFQKLTY